MKLMARNCFDADTAELGIAALRKRGFTVLTHVFPEEPDYIFAEAVCDQASSERSDVYELSCAMLREVGRVIRGCGSVDDAGPIHASHVPFESA